MLLGLGIYNFNIDSRHKVTKNDSLTSKKQEIILPQINKISIKIIPPSYTNKPTKEQAFFNLKVEENAEVDWHISTTIPVTKIDFIFNDSITNSLQSSTKSLTEWHLKKDY